MTKKRIQSVCIEEAGRNGRRQVNQTPDSVKMWMVEKGAPDKILVSWREMWKRDGSLVYACRPDRILPHLVIDLPPGLK